MFCTIKNVEQALSFIKTYNHSPHNLNCDQWSLTSPCLHTPRHSPCFGLEPANKLFVKQNFGSLFSNTSATGSSCTSQVPYSGFISDLFSSFLVLLLFLYTKTPISAAIIKKARTPAMDPMMSPVWGELLPEANSQLKGPGVHLTFIGTQSQKLAIN